MEINLKALLTTLEANAKVLGGNKVIPAYENLVFEIKEGKCTITSGDGKVQVTTVMFIDKTVTESFEVYGKTFIETLKLSDSETVTLKIKDNMLLIGAGKSKYKLPITTGNNFPRIKVEEEDVFNISNEIVTQIIKASNFDNPNDLRLALSGISIRYDKGKIFVESSDSHKFYHGSIDSNVQIPSVILQHSIANIIDTFKGSEKLEISVSKKSTTFRNDYVEVTVLNIDEKFPDVSRFVILPETFIKVNKNLLVKSIKRAMLYSNVTTKMIILTVKDSKLTVTSEDIDYNKQSKDEVDLIEANIDINIGTNGNFLLSVLSVLDAEEVKLNMDSPTTPIKINSENSSIICLVMPMVISTQ